MYIDRICSSFDKSNGYQIEECKHWAVVITDQKYHTVKDVFKIGTIRGYNQEMIGKVKISL